ncbi:ribonuclease H-like domain-containing protein [Tanacetum coccineum]
MAGGGDPYGSNSNVLINNLDAGNLLHVQTNDNSSTTLIPFKLLGTENYRIWASAMKIASHAKNKFNFVDDVYMGLVYFDNVNSIWKELECLMQFLVGMDDCYQPIKSSLKTRDPIPEVKDAYTTVSRKESHRGILETSNVSDSKLNATSFAAKSFNNNKRSFNNNNNNNRGFTSNKNVNRGSTSNKNVNRGPNPNLTCKNYGKIRHTIDRCFEIVGFPHGFKGNTNTRKQGFSATPFIPKLLSTDKKYTV